MRYGVDTNELWAMAATADDAAVALGEAFSALAEVLDGGIGSWCVDPVAAQATLTAVAAIQEQAAGARASAAGLARQLASAAQAYVDVDTLRPR